MHKNTLYLITVNAVRWFILSVSLVFFSLGISWKISSTVNFNYSMWYDTLSINKTISQFSPQNKFGKSSFEYTNKEQHVLLFAQIVNSIINDGNNLDTIFYRTIDNEKIKLLTNSEIEHLKDVSILVNKLTVAWGINLLFLIAANIYCFKRAYKAPTLKIKTFIVMFILLSILAAFFINGFTKIFYYLHTLVFPDNHQWFFYYQDSLMSTLMKAPDLFEVIAIMLLVISLPVYYLAHNLFRLTGINRI